MLNPANRHRYHSLLDAAVLRGAPDQPAVIFYYPDRPDDVVTRGAFRAATAAAAGALARAGIGPGDLVVLVQEQSPAAVFHFWGALQLGAIPAMLPPLTEKLDPVIYRERLAALIQLSGVRLVLAAARSLPDLQGLACPVLSLDRPAGPGQVAPEHAARQVEPEAIAFLQHSSGTTGLQKGVALSHRAVLNQLANYSDALDLAASDVVVSWLPLYHDMGLIAGFLLPLFQGLPLVLLSPFDWVRAPGLLFQAIDRFRGTLCWLPNFAYNHSARRIRDRDLAGLSLASMRLFINCSEPVRHDSHRLFLERFAPLGVRPAMLGASYAMAENTFAVTQTDPGRPATIDWIDEGALQGDGMARPVAAGAPGAGARVSSGQVIRGTELQVLDDEGRPLPDRRVGQIAIRGDCVLNGYYRRPDLAPFEDGWYRTGDQGYQAAGEIYVIGRQNDLIINAGKNIYPQDIEAIVNGVAGVHPGRCVAFGLPDEREGTELIVVVAEVERQDQPAGREIGRQIRAAVARQSLVTVSYVATVRPGWLIKTSSGKIARAANREKWLGQREEGSLLD